MAKPKIYYANEEEFINKMNSTGQSNYHSGSVEFREFLKKPQADVKNKKAFEDAISSMALKEYGVGADIIYIYCRRIIKKRLPEEAEKQYLISCSKGGWGTRKNIYKYAKYVYRGKLPEDIENSLINMPYTYIEYLVGKKLPYENILLNNSLLAFLFYKYNYTIPEMVHNSLIAKNLCSDKYAQGYIKLLKYNNKILRKMLGKYEKDTTVGDIIKNI